MRDLLSRRQDEQLQKRTAAAGAAGLPAPRTTHGQLQELRRELNTLVSIAHHRTGKTHGQIHKELRENVRRPTAGSCHRRADQGPHRRGAQP